MADHLMYLWVVSDEEIAAYLRRHGHEGDDLSLITSPSGDSLRRQRDKIGREVDGMFAEHSSRHNTMILAIPFCLLLIGVALMTLGAAMFPALGDLVAPLYCGDEVMTPESREFIAHDPEGGGVTETTVYKIFCLGPEGPYEPRFLIAKAFGFSLIPAVLAFIGLFVWSIRRLDKLRQIYAVRNEDCVDFRDKIRNR